MILLWTGSGFRALVDVFDEDGEPKNLSGYEVEATLSALDGLELIDDTDQDDTDPEADWTNGVVAVTFPASATSTAGVLAAIGTVAEIQLHMTPSGGWDPITSGPHRVRIERGQHG